MMCRYERTRCCRRQGALQSVRRCCRTTTMAMVEGGGGLGVGENDFVAV